MVGGNGTTASVLTLNIAGNDTFAGVLGGSTTTEKKLSLVKSGAGLLTLSGVNTYTGPTTVSAGVLSISSAGALPGYNLGRQVFGCRGAALVVGDGVTDTQVGQMLGTGNFATGGFGFDTSAGDRSLFAGAAQRGVRSDEDRSEHADPQRREPPTPAARRSLAAR